MGKHVTHAEKCERQTVREVEREVHILRASPDVSVSKTTERRPGKTVYEKRRLGKCI